MTEVRAVGYQPLVAETLALVRDDVHQVATTPRRRSRRSTEAFWAADASRHDEVRAEAAANLVYVVGYQEGNVDGAQRWATIADSGAAAAWAGTSCSRPGCSTISACVYDLQGEKEAQLARTRRRWR